MSTIITLRIQDKFENTWVKNPNHKAGDPFPNLPGADRPAHAPFDIVLQWSVTPGADPWTTNASGLLPTTNGVWEIVTTGDDPVHFSNHIAIKTSGSEGKKGFLFLSPPWMGTFGGTWPKPPFEKGYGGEGLFDTRVVGGGTLNHSFVWTCTGIV